MKVIGKTTGLEAVSKSSLPMFPEAMHFHFSGACWIFFLMIGLYGDQVKNKSFYLTHHIQV